MNITLTSKGQ